MNRDRKAFIISLITHGLIAVGAIFALQGFVHKKPGEEVRMCISIAQFAKPPVAPKVAPEPVKQTPPPPKPKPKPKPKKKVVKPKPEKPVIKEKAPVVAEPAIEEPAVETEELPEETAEAEEPTEIAAAEQYAAEPVPAASAEELYLAEHIALITQLLKEHLYYPRMARKRGITGEVTVAFTLTRNGNATAISVTAGDREILKNAAIKTIERLSGRFPKPGEPITLHVPIRYELK